MGHVAFVLAISNCQGGQETPSESALDSDVLENNFSEYSDVLVKYMSPTIEEDMEALCEDLLGPGNENPTLQERGQSG